MPIRSEARQLSRAEARYITDQIKRAMLDVTPLILSAYRGRAWVSLGYSSWSRYCAVEFGDAWLIAAGDAKSAIVTLATGGMSSGAIAETLDMNDRQVRRVINQAQPVEQVGQDDQPAQRAVMGRDGRIYQVKSTTISTETTGESCPVIVIPAIVRKSPLAYADKIGLLLADLDKQEYGPDDLTAEQLRVLENLRGAMREFALVFRREEEVAISIHNNATPEETP